MIIDSKDILSSIPVFAYIVSEGSWLPYRHLVYLANRIQDAINNGKKIIIEIPPRHGKTELMIYSLVWFLKVFPEKSVIYVTYGESLSMEKSEKARDIFQYSKQKGIGCSVSMSAKSKKYWRTMNRGVFFAAGVGSAITGRGADVLVIDDPIKNQEEAMSETYRNKIYNFFQWTLRTRLKKTSSIIVIQTRWHDDDLAGRLKKLDDYESITIPAICEDPDIDLLQRKHNEVIEPRMFSYDDLMRVKKDIGEHAFSALYQQKPLSHQSIIFNIKYFKYFIIENYKFKSDNGEILQTEILNVGVVDTTATSNTKSDYFVILIAGIDKNNNIYIIDIYRDKIETTDHEEIIKKYYKKYNLKYLFVEEAFTGYNIIQKLKREGYRIRGIKPDKNKIIRAQNAKVFYENGKIYHYQNAKWLIDYENELLQFPYSKHDDQVDCISYLCQIIGDNQIVMNLTDKDLVYSLGDLR